MGMALVVVISLRRVAADTAAVQEKVPRYEGLNACPQLRKRANGAPMKRAIYFAGRGVWCFA